MIERNVEAYLSIHRQERERATAHIGRLREARVAQKSRAAEEARRAADRPPRWSVTRLLARFAALRPSRPLRP